MIIDKMEIIRAFRTALFGAEIVEVVANPGEFVGIRDGVFEANPGIYIRPDSPAERPVATEANTQIIERSLDLTNEPFFFSEALLPALETPSASYVELLAGIMQYAVHVPSRDGNKLDIVTFYNYAKYIQNVFDPQLDNLTINQLNTEMVIDSADIAPPLKDGMWNMLPISINFRAYLSE